MNETQAPLLDYTANKVLEVDHLLKWVMVHQEVVEVAGGIQLPCPVLRLNRFSSQML